MIGISSSGSYEPFPAGTYPAACVAIHDLGTQDNPQFGKKTRQVLLTFASPDERHDVTVDGVTKDLPRLLSRFMTRSLDERASLRKFLVEWRGREFTPEELQFFDLETVLGASGMLTVVHKTKADGNIADRADSMAPMPKGTPPVKPETPLLSYSMDGGAGDLPDETPEWVAKIIMQSPEFQAGNKAPGAGDTKEEESDDVPF